MPAASEIIGGLTHAANAWSELAVAWHVVIALSLAALAFGWQPTRRRAGVMLALPMLSVSVFSGLAGNPFNTAVFAAGAATLGTLGLRLGDLAVSCPSRASAAGGAAMIAFGWTYPHFLEGGTVLRYLYAAPVGLVPCPTLSVVVGFALLAGGLGSRPWSLVLAVLGLFYGLFGWLRLGVHLDAGLIAGAGALAVVSLRAPVRRESGG